MNKIKPDLKDIFKKLINEDISIDVVQDNVYLCKSSKNDILIKEIEKLSVPKMNYLRNMNSSILSNTEIDFIPEILILQNHKNKTLIGYKWIKGSDLRVHNRNQLPNVFKKLSIFHKFAKNNDSIISPVSKKEYNTIKELIEGETDIFSEYIPSISKDKILSVFRILKNGFKTKIHGDFHPGNIVLNTNNKLFIVDWMLSINSLNFFDLDYLSFNNSNKKEEDKNWWNIINEADECLVKYLDSTNLKIDVNNVKKLITLWALYQSLFNSFNKNNNNNNNSKEILKIKTEINLFFKNQSTDL